MRSWLPLAAIAVLCALGIAVFSAWRADRRERDRLQTELTAAQKTVAQLTTQQNQRSLQLAQTLHKLAEQKSSVSTPAQALQALPAVLPLPTAIHALNLPPSPAAQPLSAAPATSKPSTVQRQPIVLPPEDLKPLFNFAMDCRACQARLAAAQADLTDEKAKSAALARERDAALRAVRGGSLWRRIGRAAKWFAIGAAAGAVAATATR